MLKRLGLASAIIGGIFMTASATIAVGAEKIRVSYETSDTHLKARTVAIFKKELEAAAKLKPLCLLSAISNPSHQK